MSESSHSHGLVVVTGDVTIDWNLARTRSSTSGAAVWTAADCTRAYWQRGGAALLADVIEAVAERLRQEGQADYAVRQTGAPQAGEPICPDDPRYHHSYASWSLFEYGVKPPFHAEKPAWRVEEFLGLDRCVADGPEATEWRRVVNDPPDAELVVLDDADLGLRDQPELWPAALSVAGSRPWILVKMARPVAQGALWQHLHQHHADRVVVVMTANDLRLTEVQISRELSWERAAQDLIWELTYNPRVNALSDCAHVVVSFNTAGALLLSRSENGEATANAPSCSLFFDPGVIEGMWEQDHPGGMIGYNTCLAAGIARQLLLAPDQPNVPQGVQSGLAAMRALHLEGYGERATAAPEARLAFPVELVVSELAREGAPFAVAEVENPVRPMIGAMATSRKPPEARPWTILESRYPDTLPQVAREIVLAGAESALRGVPLGQFGALLTVDRREIESFRSLRSAIGQYCRQRHQDRPLSIAVFGSPGSGKSFGVIEVANSILPGQIVVLQFNLSQFHEPEELLDALHRVRDAGLTGAIPLVFWDEFDTALGEKPLGWLRYFLAPMQDGCFQQGQIQHPIGRAVFVFAGGTCSTMDTFGRDLDPEALRAAKVPDFVSRLKGYVNILGPNRQTAAAGEEATGDPYYIIRRAILLRAVVRRAAPHLFQRQGDKDVLNIDPGVLCAFLQTRDYKHGVRSMEAVVSMSLLAGRSRFERSCLPAETQLDLHVDGREFLSLVQSLELEGDLLEKLAAAAHEVFCEELRSKGYRWGPQTDDQQKTHSSLRPYAELPEDEKEQNRGNVRDIPNKLAYLGYAMVPARASMPPFDFSPEEVEQLAEMEHLRWVRAKIADGWRYAPRTVKENKLHQDLLLWRRLSEEEVARLFSPAEAAALGRDELLEEEKEKDRVLVRGIPAIIRAAGYAIVRLR